MNYSKPNGIILLSAFLFWGCAGILSPSREPNMFNTQPSGAEVYDDKSIKLGETPLDLGRIPSGTKQLLIKKEGYRDADLWIRRNPNEKLMFVDAMLLCIPCPVDLNGTSAYSFVPHSPTIKLRKELPSHDNPIHIAIDEVLIDAGGTSSIILNGKKKNLSDKGMSKVYGDAVDGDEIIKGVFNKSYFDAIYAVQIKNKSGISRPRILLSPVITGFTIDMKGKQLSEYHGEQSITTTWKILGVGDKSTPLATITTTSTMHRNEGSMNRLFNDLMTESALDLLEIDTLYDFLSRIERANISDSKGKEIKINASSSSTYENMKDALKNSKQAVVTVLGKDGFGSGFIISNDGYIVTNYHVIENETNISVRLSSDMKMKASIVKTNKDYDLALLKIDVDDMKSIIFGNSDNAESGDEVYAIGTPMETSLGQTVTKGIISGKRLIGGIEFLQTDVSINAGNSGGPLINSKGELLGVTTMKMAGNGVEGIGFCIPSKKVIEMLNIKF